MRKNESLVRKLCVPYCRYYKRDKNEDLLCRGAEVVERLMQSGRSILPASKEKDLHPLNPAAEKLVVNHVCIDCDFRKSDCDFARDGTSQPCGGFVLLCVLIEQGLITIEDIQEGCNPKRVHR